MNPKNALLTLPLTACCLLAACAKHEPPAQTAPAQADAQLVQMREERERNDKNLATFDDLDFNVYSGQKWDEFHRSHAEDIVVHYPDGRTTTGLQAHLAELKPQFEFAPDTRIKVHPIKVAQGDYTAVMGVMEGTFSQPMKTPDGKSIAPTNKPFKLDMVTIGRWKNGVMVEEWLFWDNQAFIKQIGLAGG
ncbi:MAG TPA: ester cyclase [Luteimonas sp.]|nr:ester cyclase [Luteimonas sp.]